MAAITQQSGHSPFIREVLGPLADKVTPAPELEPYEDLASLWCVAGVEQMEDDLEGAVATLRVAVSYGSNDALAWLGASLVDIAFIQDRFDDPRMREMAILGLGWLDLADRCGVDFANMLFAIIQPNLPASIIEEWAARPPLFNVLVH